MSESDEKAERLAAQLRANLKRRKAQAREVAASTHEDAPPSGLPPAPPEA